MTDECMTCIDIEFLRSYGELDAVIANRLDFARIDYLISHLRRCDQRRAKGATMSQPLRRCTKCHVDISDYEPGETLCIFCRPRPTAVQCATRRCAREGAYPVGDQQYCYLHVGARITFDNEHYDDRQRAWLCTCLACGSLVVGECQWGRYPTRDEPQRGISALNDNKRRHRQFHATDRGVAATVAFQQRHQKV